MSTEKSEQLFEKAKTLFPGGVNSPVRAFGSVGGTPRFITKGKGSRVWDADGNEYIDFCASWGPLILGHANEKIEHTIVEAVKNGPSFGAPTVQENELADLILSNHRFIDRIRFVSSGTEAVMSAIRLARGYTGRNKVIKFEGCYHGHVDHLLVKAGSGLVTFGESSSAGVPKAFVDETIVIGLNDEEAVKSAFEEFKGKIAAVIIEPIPANNGLLLQDRKFLNFLRDICSQEESLRIFDEVISGFRVGFEGAAGRYNIQPDIITFGKIIGAGLPVGAYGGRADIMQKIAPLGPVYQAGTLSGNPLAMAAGIAALDELSKPGVYQSLEEKGAYFEKGMATLLEKHGRPGFFNRCGSIFYLWLADQADRCPRNYEEIKRGDSELYGRLFRALLARDVYLAPSGFEVGFISTAHSFEDLDKTLEAMDAAFSEVLGEPTKQMSPAKAGPMTCSALSKCDHCS